MQTIKNRKLGKLNIKESVCFPIEKWSVGFIYIFEN